MKPYRTPEILAEHINASMARIAPDLIISGGELVNVITGEIYNADLAIKSDRIVRVGDISDITSDFKDVKTIDASGSYVIPGLIDTHLHTESTFLTPSRFAKTVIPRGTTTVVVDPHEITNVLGLRGLEIYVAETKNLPLEFLVELPSCVPAAPSLETGPNTLSGIEYNNLLNNGDYFALAEMMNFPGVINTDPEVMMKLSFTEKYGKITEGHAPGLMGRELQAYITAGVSSCHESFMVDEAVEKLRLGMKIQLREGSFAKNLLELGRGIKNKLSHAKNPWDNVIICCDDRHADELIDIGHLDHSLRLMVNEVGIDPITAIRISTINPARHLSRPDLGAIAPGKTANINIINNFSDFKMLDVISKGQHVAHNNELLLKIKSPMLPDWAMDTFKPKFIPQLSDFSISAPNEISNDKLKAHVIGVLEHSLITDHFIEGVRIEDGKVVLDDSNDLAYFFLLDRYGNTANFSKSLVKGFGFEGPVGIASTVAHDSHQLLITGNDPLAMQQAFKNIQKAKGGQTIVTGEEHSGETLALPYAGLMSIEDPVTIGNAMSKMKKLSKTVVKGISEPFMALSFMALPVIPKLKLTDKGLVDVEKFELIDLFDATI
jgi:adenine deaminase